MRKLNALLIPCFVLVLASAVRAQNTPGVNDAELNGNYAFTFSGIKGNGSVSSVFGAVGRFTADGAGNLTNGELDTNGVSGGVAAQSFTGTYAIGADNRGVMTLNIGGGSAKLAFAMLANGNAQFIEFDASGGAGTIGSGTMEKVDTTAYSTSRITGDYAFGAAGFDNTNNRAAIEGRFTSNGTGTLTNAAGDVNAYGTDFSMTFTAANYTVSNTATGRGTMNLTFTFGGAADSLNFVFYVVNSGKLFVMVTDPVTTATPLLNGVVVQQRIPAGGFTNASLNGNMVIYLTGLSACGGATGTVPKAGAGLFTANGSGAFSLTYDENYCRAHNSLDATPGTYSVASNGRTSITIGGFSLVAYLMNLNQIFLFVSDPNVLFGLGEPQAAGSLTNSALKGPYAGFATNPAAFGVVVFSGEFTADGATPTGDMTGTEDIGDPSGPVSGAAFRATYSVFPSATNGRETMTVTSGTGGDAMIYMISPSKFVAVSLNDPNPAVLMFEQSSVNAAPNYTLSASPNSVTMTQGGRGQSTITVTPQTGFSGSVSLSASALPSGVTAAFDPNPTTSTTNSSTLTLTASGTATTGTVTVTITGTSGSLTHTTTLTLTVNPASPPPNYTLSASPNSVTMTQGGRGQSTITVTPQTGFSGSVSLSASALPSGVTAAFNPNPTTSTTNSSTLTLTASGTATTGTVTVTITGTSGSLTHTTTISLTVNALPNYTLTASHTGLGFGTVTSSPAGINDCGGTCSASFVSGTTVTLTATPGSLSGFGGWSGCDAVSGNRCTLQMNSARSVTANFTLLGLL
jgi:hypothetical protein